MNVKRTLVFKDEELEKEFQRNKGKTTVVSSRSLWIIFFCLMPFLFGFCLLYIIFTPEKRYGNLAAFSILTVGLVTELIIKKCKFNYFKGLSSILGCGIMYAEYTYHQTNWDCEQTGFYNTS
jgi:hypothetical protein